MGETTKRGMLLKKNAQSDVTHQPPVHPRHALLQQPKSAAAAGRRRRTSGSRAHHRYHSLVGALGLDPDHGGVRVVVC